MLIQITKQLTSLLKPALNSHQFHKTSYLFNSRKMSGQKLSEVVQKLNDFAPESLAEKWDNVGLLIEPNTVKNVKKIFLTNDLTENVAMEAVRKDVDLIISYHPPIFAPMKRITQSSWKERIVSILLENKIALYSPHTAWDSVRNGVNDWLANSLPIASSTPITPNVQNPDFGSGRLCVIEDDLNLKKAIELIKGYTGLNHVQSSIYVNSTMEGPIKTVAVCAGSGGSLFKNVKADLYLTGEMSHHEVLDLVHNFGHVILLNHSNSERGYLGKFKGILGQSLGSSVEIIISEADADPLSTY